VPRHRDRLGPVAQLVCVAPTTPLHQTTLLLFSYRHVVSVDAPSTRGADLLRHGTQVPVHRFPSSPALSSLLGTNDASAVREDQT